MDTLICYLKFQLLLLYYNTRKGKCQVFSGIFDLNLFAAQVILTAKVIIFKEDSLMRKNFGAQTWLFPMPVLIIGTYSDGDLPNAMNAAWGGIHDHNQIAVCIDPPHKTAENLLKRGFFTVSCGTAERVVECDYVGIVSGNDEPRKIAAANLHARKGEFADAPVFDEFPVALECKLVSFDPKTGCTVGEILNVTADESVLDEKGNITFDKFHPLIYDPVSHNYYSVGTTAGKAFCDGKKLKK